MVIKFLEKLKSPGPGSMTHENWKALDPKLVPSMVRAFNETFTSGQIDPECFQFYVKPLSNKPGNTWVHKSRSSTAWLKSCSVFFSWSCFNGPRKINWLQTFNFMKDMESKKGAELFLLSLDLTGVNNRVDNTLLYGKLKASGHLDEWRTCTFHSNVQSSESFQNLLCVLDFLTWCHQSTSMQL